MAVAQLAGMRSKDPSTQVGSCIVSDEHKILSMGYNGLPTGCSDDDFPWERDGKPLMTKYPYAEADSTIASKRMFDAAGVTYRQYERSGRKIEISL